MASKYASFRGKLPAFELESSYQERVNAAKKEIVGIESGENANVSKLAASFAVATKEKKRLEELVSLLNVELEALSQLLRDALETEGHEGVELYNGTKVGLKYEPYPSVKDKEKFMAWVEKEKLHSMLVMHHQTLKSITKERLMDGKPPIPGTEVFLKATVTIRNGKELE